MRHNAAISLGKSEQGMMKQILARTLCVAALLSAVSAAQAALYNFNVLRTAGGTTGWNVQLESTDLINWNVLGIQSLAGSDMATAPADTINFSFFDGSDVTVSNQILMVSGAGGTNIGPNPLLGGDWEMDPFKFNTPLGARQLQPSGPNSNIFTGSFTLESGDARYLQMRIQGPVEQWNSDIVPLVPEMPGNVLLLAALVPVGFIARKRFAA